MWSCDGADRPEVLELSAAAEAVDDEASAIVAAAPVGPEGVPELGKPQVFSDLARHGLVACVEAERPGKPATACIEYFDLVTERAEDRHICRGADYGALVAMRVDERPARPAGTVVMQTLQEPGRDNVLGGTASKRRQPRRARVVRQQRWQLVPEGREAARFGDDHRYTGTGPGLQHGDKPPERLLGAIEHAEVVERAPATGPRRRHRHTFTHGAERFNEVGPIVGAERIGESVGPDDDGTLPRGAVPHLWQVALGGPPEAPSGSEQRRRASPS